MITSVGTLSKSRNRVLHLGLHHFNPPYQGKITRQRQDWERKPMVSPRIKGCRLKYERMGHKSTIGSFLSQVLLLQCLQVAQYISPQLEVKGRFREFLRLWKKKSQVIHYLMREKLQIFILEHIS